jgi:hypothetical protein
MSWQMAVVGAAQKFKTHQEKWYVYLWHCSDARQKKKKQTIWEITSVSVSERLEAGRPGIGEGACYR